MRRKTILFSSALLVVIIGGIVAWYIHQVYYFNPFTFKRDDVTTVAWNVYKNPMQMVIVYQPAHGAATQYTTENRSEMNYVLSQLKEAKPTSYKPPANGLFNGQIWIQFRNPKNQNDYADAVLQNNMTVVLLQQVNPVTVTNGLKNFISQKRSTAKPM